MRMEDYFDMLQKAAAKNAADNASNGRSHDSNNGTTSLDDNSNDEDDIEPSGKLPDNPS